MMKEHLLVDGFNLFHANQTGRSKTHHFRDIQGMVFALEHYAASSRKSVTVVLDGRRFESQINPSGTLEILFSEPGQAADEVIERFMMGIPERERLEWALITDDRALSHMAQGAGFRWRRCEHCLQDLVQFQEGRSPSYQEPKRRSRDPFNSPFQEL